MIQSCYTQPVSLEAELNKAVGRPFNLMNYWGPLANYKSSDWIVDAVIAENPKAVEDFHAGKASAVQFLMGQVMKRTKGRARPDVVIPLLQSKLGQA